MSMLLLALAAATQAPEAGAQPLPNQRALYRILFADIHTSLLYVHSEIGFSPRWTQGYDVNISALDCTQDGRSAVCRFRLTRTPDGTPQAIHAGTANNILGCRAELRYARGPDDAPEAWRVRQWPGPAGTQARSTMRCDRDRAVE
jgi:hypothetical protein